MFDYTNKRSRHCEAIPLKNNVVSLKQSPSHKALRGTTALYVLCLLSHWRRQALCLGDCFTFERLFFIIENVRNDGFFFWERTAMTRVPWGSGGAMPSLLFIRSTHAGFNRQYG